MSTRNDIFKIVNVSPNLIQIEVLNFDKFKDETKDFTIGSYLKISDDSKACIIAIVESFKIKELNSKEEDAEIKMPSFILDAQPIGFIDENGQFRRGGQRLAIPPSDVEIADTTTIQDIYASIRGDKRFTFSTLAQNPKIDVPVDGDKFFSKHIAVLGSTGSGKSGTVSRILQEAIAPSKDQDKKAVLNNSHIILFDLHGEYHTAFPDSRYISIENLVLPYWLMNAEELEELFIESSESNSHNQVSQFKRAVTLNKQKHNPTITGITYDTPVYFSLTEVCRYISNHNLATKDAKTGELKIKAAHEGIPLDIQMFDKIEFEEKATGKINGGPYAGEFDRFILRLETKLSDERLNFLLKPKKNDGDEYKTEDLIFIIRQLTGYINSNESNITIIDLSGIPFEVLSIVVSLISRLIFDFCFHFKKRKAIETEIPFLLVLEEAHNYIPQSQSSKFNSVRKSVERIAKEGRKYGLSLMVVSQRPSEISETIFSQCNNFVVMRLTNPADQQYVKRLLPDNVQAITDTLPILEKQEALLIGDSLALPSIVRIMDLDKNRPASNDVSFRTEWQKDWQSIAFEQVVKKLTRE